METPGLIQSTVTALLTSTLLIGALCWFVKYYMKKMLDLAFKTRAEEYSKKLDIVMAQIKENRETAVATIPELIKIASTIKDFAAEIPHKKNAAAWNPKMIGLIKHYCQLFNEKRSFLQADLFEPLHDLKHLYQDLVFEYDILTRNDFLFDQERSGERMRKALEILPKINASFGVADEICRNYIVSDLEKVS
jgi:hypothetical protein